MKKILCILLCVVTLLPCFTMLASAAEEQKDIVLEELKNFTINGKAFDAADYPVDTSKTTPELLTIREVGVDPDRPVSEWIADYELYFYFYDPAASFEHWEGSVYMTFDEGKPDTITEDMRRYFSDVRMSADGRFIRAKLEPMGPYSGAFDNLQDRVYHIHRYSLAYTYFDDYIFHVTGSEKNKNLQYADGGELTMDLELHGSVWRYEDPISKDDLNTYNEIATVYFTIPKVVYEQYDHIQKITADFKQFLSSPIVVTNSPTVNSMAVDFLKSGKALEYYREGVPSICYGEYEYFLPSFSSDIPNKAATPEWSYNAWPELVEEYERIKKKTNNAYANYVEQCDSLSFYFYDPDIDMDQFNNFYQVKSTLTFAQYIDQYMAFYYPDMSFETGVAPELYESCDINFGVEYIYGKEYEFGNFRPQLDLSGWQWLCAQFGHVYGKEYTEKIPMFSVIENPAEAVEYYSSFEKVEEGLIALSNELKIGRNDAAGFLEYLKTVDGYVVLLRFATSQYECQKARVYDNGVKIDDGDIWVVRMPYYRDVDVTTVTFRRGTYDFTYTVNADPLDHIDGGVSVKDDYKNKTTVSIDGGAGWWDKIVALFNETVNYMTGILLLIVGVVVVYGVVSLLRGGGKTKVDIIISEEKQKHKKRKRRK